MDATRDELCLCGRFANVVHCPKCGYATVQYKKRRKDYATRPDGTRVELRVYQCRKCGEMFNDDDWQLHCVAPPPRGAKAPRMSPAPVAGAPDLSQQTPEELQDALQRALRMSGRG